MNEKGVALFLVTENALHPLMKSAVSSLQIMSSF